MARDTLGPCPSALATVHPGVLALFFGGAIVLGACLAEPACQALAIVAAAGLWALLEGRRAWRLLAGLALAFLAIAAINPLLNPEGATVLFTYLGGRAYTAEALAFGASTGALFATLVLWFACLGAAVTSERALCLLAPLAPSLALLLCMVARLVPAYRRKAAQVASARACIGKGAAEGSPRQRVAASAAVLAALAGWAFEGAIDTADSMRSRGFGTGPRTCYVPFRFGARDGAMAAVLLACLAVVAWAMASGAMAVQWFPAIQLPAATPAFWAGLGAYAAYLALPLLVEGRGRLQWRFWLSRA